MSVLAKRVATLHELDERLDVRMVVDLALVQQTQTGRIRVTFHHSDSEGKRQVRIRIQLSVLEQSKEIASSLHQLSQKIGRYTKRVKLNFGKLQKRKKCQIDLGDLLEIICFGEEGHGPQGR